jgi:hypothetical protein
MEGLPRKNDSDSLQLPNGYVPILLQYIGGVVKSLRIAGAIIVGLTTLAFTTVSGLTERELGITQLGWGVITLLLFVFAQFLAYKAMVDRVGESIGVLNRKITDLTGELESLQNSPVISLDARVNHNNRMASIQAINTGTSDIFNATCMIMADGDAAAYDLAWTEVNSRGMQINNGDRGTLAIAELDDNQSSWGQRLTAALSGNREIDLVLRRRTLDDSPEDEKFTYKIELNDMEAFRPLVLKVMVSSPGLESAHEELFELSVGNDDQPKPRPVIRLIPMDT